MESPLIAQVIDDQTGIVYTVDLTVAQMQQAQTDKSFIENIIAGLRNGTVPFRSSSSVQDEVPYNEPDEVPDKTEDDSRTSSEECTDSWTPQGTLQFITEYENLRELIEGGKIKQKDAFKKIANNLRKKKMSITAKQCATKLASLKRTYKKIKDHNNKSGNDRQTWEHFERIDNMFGKKPWVNPVALCAAGPEVDGEDVAEEVPVSRVAEPKKRRSSSIDEKVGDLVTEMKKRRHDRDRQHAEAMERMDKLLDILQPNSSKS